MATPADSLHDRRVAGANVGAVLGPGLGDDGVELHGGAAVHHPADALVAVGQDIQSKLRDKLYSKG